MRTRIVKLAHWITVSSESIAAVLLVAVVLMNLAQVTFRYVLNDPLSWTEESMRYATVWMVFLAGSAALFRGEHMVINVFAEVRSPRVQWALHIAVLGCIAAFSLLLVWKGVPVALRNARQLSPSMQIPMVWPYMAVGAGGALMLLKALALLMLPPQARAAEEDEENRP